MKVFLEQDGKLLILKDSFGDWDLPGGRIKKDEFSVPFDDIITRKMIEELGATVVYTIGKPVVLMRHERNEMVLGSPLVRIFAVGYRGTLVSGDIQLSLRHTEMKWVDVATFDPKDYFRGGWLQGVEEYLEIARS